MTTPSLADAPTDDGVSVWLDGLGRGQLTDGTLPRLIKDSAVSGVTSKPTIHQTTPSATSAYADQLYDLGRRRVDVGEAADLTADALAAIGAAGAAVWASTGTRDPSYDPVKYPVGPVADGTITTMPPTNLAAVTDQRPTKLMLLDDQAEDADAVTDGLSHVDSDLDYIARQPADSGPRTEENKRDD